MTTIICAAMHDEYVRLCERRSALRVLKERIKAEEPIVENRLTALRAAMTAFGREEDYFTADTHIADAYRLGLPLDFILQIIMDNWVQDNELEWTEDAIKKRAHELGVRRPAGWTETKADADWKAADIEDDDWLDRPYGLPDPTVALDKPAPLLMLAAPAVAIAKPAEIMHDPIPETLRVTQEGVCIVKAPSPMVAPAKSVIEPPAKKLTGPRIPLDQRQKTPERVALLKNIWFTERTHEQIVNELSMLPGAQVRMENLGPFVVQWDISKTSSEEYRQDVIKQKALAAKLSTPVPPTSPPVKPTPAAIPMEIPIAESPPLGRTDQEAPMITFGPNIGPESKALMKEAGALVGLKVEDPPPIRVPDPLKAETKPGPQSPQQNGTSLGDIVRAVARETPAVPSVPAPKPNLTTPSVAKAAVQGIAAANGEPVVAQAEFIIRWAGERGIIGRSATDILERVNAKRRMLQQPPFAIAGRI